MVMYSYTGVLILHSTCVLIMMQNENELSENSVTNHFIHYL